MPRRKKGASTRRKGGASSSFKSTSFLDRTVRFETNEMFALVSQATSGVAPFTSANTGQTGFTNTSTVTMTTDYIGGRLLQMSELFQQWRVKRMWLQFVPNTTSSGVILTNTPTTAPTYAENQICIAVSADPGGAPNSFLNAVQSGGFVARTSSPFRFQVRQRSTIASWMQTDPVANSNPSLSLAAPGIITGYFSAAGSTTAVAYGYLFLQMEVLFRYPKLNTNAAPDTRVLVDDDEKKLNETLILVERAISSSSSRVPLKSKSAK